MLILLSPAKTQDFEIPSGLRTHTQPELLYESQILMRELRKLSQKQIAATMGVSAKIAALNHERFRQFKTPFTERNAKQAVFAFRGDVYTGLNADSFSKEHLHFAQSRLRILSGLYGALRPLDLIQPYRLEMKTRLANPRGRDLYAFWGERITQLLAAQLKKLGESVVVNLASEEYSKAVDFKKLDATVITPQFREKKGADYKNIALFAKVARGRMAHDIIQRGITEPDALQFFSEDGYRLNVALSKPESPVYTRDKFTPGKSAKAGG